MNSEKKGELAELKASLRQFAGSRAPGSTEAKRELFKKVISYMTIGIDVSGLFTEMIMGSGATSDLVLKKMCYLYICSYAASNSELALLTINFLQKDCQDEDPMIRGLALRSLCSLRVKNLVEYLVGPLKTAVRDSNPYVRTMAAMGILKLYYLAPAACQDAEFVPALKRLLMNDPDPQVVANAVCALQEISEKEAESGAAGSAGGRQWLLSKEVIYTLLNRIRDFSEWAQCIILALAAEYEPEESNEIFDIMNLLEDRLQHANSAVVLATTKVFLHLTMAMADVHQQVYERIKAPLLTLISTGSPELAYAVLSHLHLLVTRAPMLFAADYKHFYCRFSDPSYVKKLKLEMLTAVANETNTYDIVSELSEYAANVDVVIARESVRAVGQIALQSYDVNGIVDRLLQFLDMDTDYITAETLVLVKDLLRKYPEWAESCVAVIGGVEHAHVAEREAKAALVWMLGEYGQDVSDAPYVLESIVEGWVEEESESVRLEVLTAVAKLFFKRPPECHKLLGRVLKLGTEDGNQDVHDRALLYYRLLQQGANVAEKVINTPKRAVNEFAETQSSEAKDRIFDEFNTLSVVYRQPSFQFMTKAQPKADAVSEEEPASPSGVLQSGADFADQELLSGAEKEEVAAGPAAASNGGAETYSAPNVLDIMSGPPVPSASNGIAASVSGDPFAASAQAPVAETAPSNSGGLGGALDDLLGGFGGLSTGGAATQPQPPTLQLVARPTLDAGTFQRKWGQLPVGQAVEDSLQPQTLVKLTSPPALLRHMASNSIACMASGGAPPSLRFFFYAQSVDSGVGSGFFLVELIVNTAKGTASAKVKAEQAHLVEPFVQAYRTALMSF